jgi:hypothetical protein
MFDVTLRGTAPLSRRRDNNELLKTIREKRETAARIRRVARALSLKADQLRLMQQADDLVKEATQLERQLSETKPASPAAPRGMPMQTQQVQQQVQQQQQHEAEQKPSEDKS